MLQKSCSILEMLFIVDTANLLLPLLLWFMMIIFKHLSQGIFFAAAKLATEPVPFSPRSKP